MVVAHLEEQLRNHPLPVSLSQSARSRCFFDALLSIGLLAGICSQPIDFARSRSTDEAAQLAGHQLPLQPSVEVSY